MSEPLSSFSIRVGKPLQSSEGLEGSSAFFGNASQTSENHFLGPQPEVPESFLNLGESSRVSVDDSPDTEVMGGELLRGSDGVLGDDVAGAPLLCLDPSTGLHVLVHSLCQSLEQPPVQQNLQDSDVAPEQFVVVWALQSEEEPMVLEKSLENVENKTTALDGPSRVDTILGSPVMSLGNSTRDHPAQQIFSSSIGPTDLGIEMPPSQNYENNQGTCKEDLSPLIDIHGPVATAVGDKIQHKNTSLVDCSDASMLTLQVADDERGIGTGTELQRDILMETVPHINLEEIIEKFTSESNHALIENEKTDTSMSEKNGDYAVTVERESITLQDDLPNHRSFTVLPEEKPKASSRSNVTVKLKTSATNVIEESLDEESFYDILMTYKCKLCSEVFVDKARLLKHYEEVHKSRKGVKIYVTSESSSLATLRSDFTNSSTKEKVLMLNSNTSVQKTRDLNLMTCRLCFRTFLGVRELEQHVTQEHPTEITKKARKRKHKVVLGLPTQPGLLFGHRESRLPTEEDTEDDKVENQKRRIRAPRNLGEQYWVHKQRPKPVLLSDKKRLLKCSVDHCRFRFTTKENVKEHVECHGTLGSSEEKLYFCSRCSERFPKWGVCQLHLWKVHSVDVDLLTCGICHTYKTNAEQKLIIHQKIHSDIREYVCKVCGKGFRQHAQLLNHEVLHICNEAAVPQWHQKGFCTKCEKWFVDKQTLKRHMNNIHLKVKRHICPHCPYKCTRKYDLGIHIRKHTGEKPHQCEFCGRWYRDHTTIRRHKWIHFLIKPFRCPLVSCQYETSRIPHFKKHMTKKHPKSKLWYKCQTCCVEIAELQNFIRHISIHEEQLYREAMDRRTSSSALSTDTPLNGRNNGLALRLAPPVPEEVDNVNIKIEAVDDEGLVKNVKVSCNRTRSATTSLRHEPFVFGTDVVSDDGVLTSQSSEANRGMAVKVPSNITVSGKDVNIRVEAVDDGVHVRKVRANKGERENAFTDIGPEAFVFESVDSVQDVGIHNSQVFTINVNNLETPEAFLKGTEDARSLVRCKSEFQKAAEPERTGFDEMMETDLLGVGHREPSTLRVVHGNDRVEPKMLDNMDHETTVLNVVESSEERTPVLSGEEENPTLMTLSQVMLEDGHQYIIGF